MEEFRDEMRTAQLVEANERLVIAALDAQAVAESTAAELQTLARSSQRDALTDTPNRALMLDRISHAVAMARRKGTRSAVLFLDIDRFKRINDTLGHAAGDQALQLVARRLKTLIRDSDTVSRHGGDEFLVLLSEVSSASAAGLIAATIRSSLARSSLADGRALPLSVSIGIAVYPEDGDDADTLIRCADAAMYRAKNRAEGFEARSGRTADAAAAADNPDARERVMIRRAEAPEQPARFEELREANEKLVLAALNAQELQAAAETALRREIGSLATLAHELRHPLAPILTAAGVMKRVCVGDPLLPRIQAVIERQAVHMARLVDDLLDQSRMSTGKLRLDRCEVEMATVLEQAVETCRPAIDRRRQQFKLQLPPCPLQVYGDRFRLVQIFVNLLHNACKYTPEGGMISISVAARGDRIEIVVSDDGVGITAEALPHVFDLFVQDAHGLAMSDNDGLGIGLAVVRELVEAHDGSVTAASAGRGSTFVVTLPMLDGLPET
jgi:diguanylate cyclase (GGDEF)-like protein